MTEQVLIEVKVEEDGGDFAKLAQLKNSLINIKQEQKDLAEAFKKGNITQKEYAEGASRLEVNQKKLSAAYSETQKKITGLKSPFENLSQAVKEQGKQVSIAGVSLSSFVNPVTSTIALLGGLFKAYSQSTIGAKDLEFAQNQLSSASNIATNAFIKLFGLEKEGQGFFSKLADLGIRALSFANLPLILGKIAGIDAFGKLADDSKEIARLQEVIDDLQREEIQVRGDIQERLEENAALQTKIADAQTSFNDKVIASEQIQENLKQNQKDIVSIKEKELEALNKLLEKDTENEDLQQKILTTQKDLNRERTRAERLIQAAARNEDNIKETEEKRVQALREQTSELERQARIATLERELKGADKSPLQNVEVQTIKLKTTATEEFAKAQEHLGELVDANKKKQDDADKKFIKSNEAKQTFYQNWLQLFTFTFSAELQKQNDFAKAYLKSFLLTSLTMIKNEVQARIFGTELANKGFPFGLITGALGVAAIEGIFQGAASAIEGFAEGGASLVSGRKVLGSDGVPIKRSNGDTRLVTMFPDEVVLNPKQQQALGGPVAMRMAGVPGFAGGGGYSDSLSRSIFNVGRDQNLIASIRQQRTVLVIEDVERLIDQRISIRERARM